MPGYDLTLPSKPPFMWIEREERVSDDFLLIAFGAYNAFGLIGTEKGGVALVSEKDRCVIGTIDIPWAPKTRDVMIDLLIEKPKDQPLTVAIVVKRALDKGMLFRRDPKGLEAERCPN